MDTLLAILFQLLALAGVDVGGATFVNRATSNGTTTLESRAEVSSGVARFQCMRSATGHCHYAVLPARCTGAGRAPWPTSRCPTDAVERFSLAAGESRRVAGLARFELCVGGDPATCAGEPGDAGRH